MYQIAIPTLSRVNILLSQTIKTLEHHNISKSQITIFCIDKEYDQYKNIFHDYNIVVGKLGLIEQKEFIQMIENISLLKPLMILVFLLNVKDGFLTNLFL